MVKYFLNNLRNPTIAVRLWTANWSVPMIEELYANIKNQQFSPQYFSTVVHLTIQQAIRQISDILAEGLLQIWKCKAATITPINNYPTLEKVPRRKRTPSQTTLHMSTQSLLHIIALPPLPLKTQMQSAPLPPCVQYLNRRVNVP